MVLFFFRSEKKFFYEVLNILTEVSEEDDLRLKLKGFENFAPLKAYFIG